MSYMNTTSYQPNNTRRMVGFGLVVLLHVVLIVAFKNGLEFSGIQKISIPMIATIIEPASEPQKPSPPPPPEMTKPNLAQPDIPVPELAPSETALEEPVANTDASASTDGAISATEAKVDPSHPLTQPPYPPTSRRLGEQGTVQLLLYVQPNGRVSEAKVQRSSGFPRLDESAVNEAKRAWRFVPNTQGGTAVAGWCTIAIKFKLTE